MCGIRSPITAARPGLKMPAFLTGDLLERRAEIFGVIQANRRHAGDERLNHIRRVEPAAETGFDQRDVGARPREIFERHRGRGLEKAGADVLPRAACSAQ